MKIFTKLRDTYSQKEHKKSRSLSHHPSTKISPMKLMESCTTLVESYQPTTSQSLGTPQELWKIWSRYLSTPRSLIKLHLSHTQSSRTFIGTTLQQNIQESKKRGDMSFRLLSSWVVLEGRSLIKQIRSSCKRCRYLLKRKYNVSMGPLSQENFTITPAFYCVQTDLAGPFLSYSQHHKRTTVKIWLIVFCCATTNAVKIKVMDDYSTTSFLLSFTTFACEVRYPKKLLVDEGSQLLKGCETMRIHRSSTSTSSESKGGIQSMRCWRSQCKRTSRTKNQKNHRFSLLQWGLASSIQSTIRCS